MLIRSKIHRPNAPVTLGTMTYFFRPVDGTANGPHVCEVSEPAHIARLLEITEGYEAFEVPTLARVPAPPAPSGEGGAPAPPSGDPPPPAPPVPDGVDPDRVLAIRGLSVVELRAQVPQITDAALLTAVLSAEEAATQPPPRRTVVDLLRQRIATLSA